MSGTWARSHARSSGVRPSSPAHARAIAAGDRVRILGGQVGKAIGAIVLLVLSFLADALDEVEDEALRTQIGERLEDWLTARATALPGPGGAGA